ncbi:MAG: hypothetical protein ACOH1T_12360 [Microbacteriaceae bacterium]
MAQSENQFDPRYNPAFQPGYEADAPQAATGGEPQRASLSAASLIEPLAPVVAAPTPAHAPVAAARTVVTAGTEAAVGNEGDDEDTDAVPSGRNPWLIALWIVGAVLIVLGVSGQVLYEKIFSPYLGWNTNTPTVENFYVIPAVLNAFSTWLAIVGVVAIVVAVAIRAVEWQRVSRS